MKSRKYTLKRRAERQARTRERIVRSVVELHTSLGPSATTWSAIARRAGVERLTVRRHFPDERALFAACSSYNYAQDRPPDPARWRAVADPRRRVRRGLTELYAYFRRRRQLLTHVFRDAEVPAVRWAMSTLVEHLALLRKALMEGWPAAQGPGSVLLQAVIGHALHFPVWDSLTAGQGLTDRQAARVMTVLVQSYGRGDPARASRIRRAPESAASPLMAHRIEP